MGRFAYEFRTLKARDLWLPLSALFSVFGAAIALDKVATGWLIAMSCAVIVIVGQSFSDAIAERRYWATLILFAILHSAILFFSNERWIPARTAAITPLFLFDYLAMGWAFPRISGLRFNGI